jgi:thioredoxin-related protein
MKKLFSVLGILAIPFFLHCGEVNYFSGTWDETIKKAKAENKYVMLDCYTDWCSWCKVMDKSTFKSDTITTELDKYFVAAHREMEKDPEGLAISMKYHVQAFPTFLFFSPEGKLIYEIAGYRPTADFLKELKKVEDPKSHMDFPGYGPALDPGFPDFYKNSFGTKDTRKTPEKDVVNKFLDTQKDITGEVPWAIISRFPISEKYSNAVLANSAKLRKLYGKDQLDQKIYSIVRVRVDTAAARNDEKLLSDALSEVDKDVPGDNNSIKVYWKQIFYEKNNEWGKLADVIQTLIDTGKIEMYGGYINGISWDFYEKCDDIKTCERTLPWMKKVTEATPEYASMDTYASLLYKTGHYKDAKDIAIKAIELGKTSGEKTETTEKLLLDIQAKLN